jgi:hypothetical protein
MTKEKVEIGAKYLAEIKALNDVIKTCSAYGWIKLCEYNKVVDDLSLLGTDYGKPNATPLMTELAKGNRQMFSQMKEIVEKRIKALEEEFSQL